MPDERYEHIARLRQQGLDAARTTNTDYLLVCIDFCLTIKIITPLVPPPLNHFHLHGAVSV